jgi:hypothetical protein
VPAPRLRLTRRRRPGRWSDDCGCVRCYLGLLPSTPFSTDRRKHRMALEEAIAILAVLMPLANAIPVLGAPVESSLETLSMILEFAKARP